MASGLVSRRQSALSANRRSPAADDVPSWREQVTTVVAIGLGVLLVAVVPVLMGSV